MFPRLLDWLRRLPPGEDGTSWSVRLAHSKAALNEHFAGLMAVSKPVSAVDLDGEERSRRAVVRIRSHSPSSSLISGSAAGSRATGTVPADAGSTGCGWPPTPSGGTIPAGPGSTSGA